MKPNYLKWGFWGGLCVVVAIVLAAAVGIYQIVEGIPEHKAVVSELTRDRDAWKAQALDQDRYIQQQRKHIAELQAAMNFENLLVYTASPQGLIDMQQIENMLKNKAEFCLSGEKQALEPKAQQGKVK